MASCPNCGQPTDHSQQQGFRQGPYQQPYQQQRQSKRIAAGVLAILLGGLGLHYFIVGKPIAGLITIVLSMISCGIWPIVMLVQGILILCMSDEEFEAKYVHSYSTYPLF